MAAEIVLTLGNSLQIRQACQGELLNGHREPRIVIVGRSNVGKSSFINELTSSKVAYVSKQPGKTRLVHCYQWQDKNRILVDLPGYGFAQVSKADRDQWAKLITQYLESDEGIDRALVLLDCRHDPSVDDVTAIDFLISRGCPVTVVLSKLDTLKRQAEKAARQKAFKSWFGDRGLDHWPLYWISSKTGEGIKPLAHALCSQNK